MAAESRASEGLKASADAAYDAWKNVGFEETSAPHAQDSLAAAHRASADVASYKVGSLDTPEAFMEELAINKVLADQIRNYASKNSGASFDQVCTPVDTLVKNSGGDWIAARPTVANKTVTEVYKLGADQVDTIKWLDTEGKEVQLNADFKRLLGEQWKQTSNAYLSNLTAMDLKMTATRASIDSLDWVSEKFAGDTDKIDIKIAEIAQCFDANGKPLDLLAMIQKFDKSGRGQAKLNAIGRVVPELFAKAMGNDEAALRKVTNLLKAMGIDVSSGDVETIQEQVLAAKTADPSTWNGFARQFAEGCGTALKIILKDVIGQNLAVILQAIFLGFLINVWGPKFANYLDRLFKALSSCSMHGLDDSVYRFDCMWYDIADDDQFDLNFGGLWCSAPDCFSGVNCDTQAGIQTNAPGAWGMLRKNDTPKVGGGSCLPDERLSCANTVGLTLCPSTGPPKAKSYRWTPNNFVTSIAGTVQAGANFLSGFSSWFGRNGLLLVAGIFLLFIVIIPLITHFISSL